VQVIGDNQRGGSDFMVDVFKSLGFEYVCANPGSSFRGLHESIINYGGNHAPEMITCMHEESAVAMAHGYFKAEGKPMLVAAHGTVGLQHASMALYNAWCDRVPVYLVIGNYNDAAVRRPAEWYHGLQQAARMLVAAESPVLVVDRLARTPNGMKLLVELAELVGAGVIDQTSRMNFPTRHPLNQSLRAAAAVGDADLVVGLEVADFWASVN